MRIEIQLWIAGDDDRVISVDKVLHLDRSDGRMEAVGLSLGEDRAVDRRSSIGHKLGRTWGKKPGSYAFVCRREAHSKLKCDFCCFAMVCAS